jgi:type IV pilus assembly protein PilE
MKETRGFTLLELLMVVIIIAILAAIALPQYINATERARAAEAISTLGSLRGAELRYKAQNLSTSYTNVAAQLDTTIGASQQWGVPVITVTAAAAGTPAKGNITVARSKGQFGGQTVGIQLGSGTLCGTFAPLALAACVQD